MEWLLMVGILLTFVITTMSETVRKDALGARFANDPASATIETFVPELHRPPGL
jgi:hypothetical protein